MDGPKAVGLVHQCHIDATLVGRRGDEIFVVQGAQHTATGKMMHHTVVLHLAQRHNGRRLGCREDGACYLVTLVAIACGSPSSAPLRQKFGIILPLVVQTVKQVLTVQFHQNQQGGKQQLHHHVLTCKVPKTPPQTPQPHSASPHRGPWGF